MHQRLAGILLVFCLKSGGTLAADDTRVDYVQDVKPILSSRCYGCHGAVKQQHDLRLDTAELAKRGGSGGPAVVPGNVEESLLIAAVTGTQGLRRMPPEGEPLKEEQIELLKRWIAQGAPAPAEKTPDDPRKHWAFVPPVAPPIPEVEDPAWSGNPIDRFIAAAHKQRGLVASPPAARHQLLRRVYLDLIGLPPTRAELHAFLSDRSADAWEKVVDRLLESPQYGQRWARHWMDIWRYSDWDGFGAEVRESHPHIWRWRDWIVESLNADRPYDQMIVDMLAGDEAGPGDPATERATGYLARNWYMFNRHVWIDATIEHTCKAFLGITMNCARCHDHMYDPITQQDYYRLRAFFEPHGIRIDRVPGQPDTKKDGLLRVFDADLAAPTWLFRRGDDKQPDKDHPLAPGLPALFGDALPAIAQVPLPPEVYYPALKPFAREEELAAARQLLERATAAVPQAQDRLAAARNALATLTERAAQPKVVLEDNFSRPRPEAWRAGPGVWAYREGRLVQSDAGDAFMSQTSVQPHPADFSATLRFRTTGGDQYKSVGLSFDAVEDRSFCGFYLSAVGKAQLFERVAGADRYPAEAARSMPVELNREYELRVAVRGNLVNAWVDGVLVVAYALPNARPADGRLSIWTYDATAEFLNVRVEELSSDAALVRNIGEPVAPRSKADFAADVRAAERAVELAELALRTARANLLWVESRQRADLANYLEPNNSLAEELSLVAARAERAHKLCAAHEQKALAEFKLDEARRGAAGAPKLSEAEAALAHAVKAHEALVQQLQQPPAPYTRAGGVYPATSTGRRLALARWIADRRNPLTARVAVNHLWARHIGQPLVSTVFDFGLNGKPPSHPELLDWLAVEFMQSGWRMKHLHRLIVTSRAYCQQSAIPPAEHPNRALDPDNTWLWRMTARRMEAEVVRDSTLHVAGSLDLAAGGPELDENAGMTLPRRSLYFRNSKEKKMTFLDQFDRANVVDCYRRAESIVPQQALAMANSPLSRDQSRLLARKLAFEVAGLEESQRDVAFVVAAYEQILSRPPTEQERQQCLAFLSRQTQLLAEPTGLTRATSGGPTTVTAAAEPARRAAESLVHVLLNHNDFLTIR